MNSERSIKKKESTDSLIDEGRFAKLLEQIVSRFEAGERLRFQTLAQEYPEFESRLKKLWPTMEMLVDLPHSENHGSAKETEVAKDSEARKLGDFRLIREIGRGGMGVVYEAEQISLGRQVALKVLPFAAVLDERQLQRFRNEARAAAGLQRPGIVPVFSVGCEQGVHYYAMQMIEGWSLATLIDERKHQKSPNENSPLAETVFAGTGSTELVNGINKSQQTWCQQVARLGKQVAESLAYAHSVSIVHRDIKPSNLLLDYQGQVWVADFGLAQIGTDSGLTMSGDLIGTLRYMSPEQRGDCGTQVDHRTDIFSLGATLFELLTMEPLRSGTTRTELLQSDEDASRLRQLNPSVPHDLETIVLKATAPEPTERYATAQNFADDLQRFLNHQPVLARRLGTIEQLARWTRKRPGVVWSIAGILLISATVSMVAAVLISQAGNRTEQALVESSQHLDCLNSQRIITLKQTQRAERLNANLLSERGISLVNAGLSEGLFDLAEAAEQVAQYDDKFARELVQLWSIASLPWQDRLVLSESRADVLAFSPDGKWLALAGDKECRIWSVQNQTYVESSISLDRTIGAVVFSPDSRLIVTHSIEGSARLWNVTDGSPAGPVLRHHLVPVEYPANATRGACFTPDGKLLITSGADGTVRVWSVLDRKPVGKHLSLNQEVWGVAVSPDGRWFSAGTVDGKARLWSIERVTTSQTEQITFHSVEALREVEQVRGVHSGQICFSPNSEWFATQQGIWNLKSFQQQAAILHHHSEALAFDAESHRVLTSGFDRLVRIWDLASGKELLPAMKHEARVRDIAFSPDGKIAAAGVLDETVKLWNLKKGSAINPALPLPGPVSRILFHPDGTLIAGCSMWGPARVWRTDRHAAQELPIKSNAIIRSARLCFDGTQLAVGDENGHVKLFDTKNYHLIGEKQLGNQPISALAWRHDQQLIAIASLRTNTIRILDRQAFLDVAAEEPDAVPEEKSTLTLKLPTSKHNVLSLDFSPDGELLAEGSAGWSVHIWSLRSRSIIKTIRCHEQVLDIRFSDDGSQVMTALRDGTIRRWSISTGEQVGESLKRNSPVWSACRVGKLLISSSGDANNLTGSVQTIGMTSARSILNVPSLNGLTSLSSHPVEQYVLGINPSGQLVKWNFPAIQDDDANLTEATIKMLGVQRQSNGRLIDVKNEIKSQ